LGSDANIARKMVNAADEKLLDGGFISHVKHNSLRTLTNALSSFLQFVKRATGYDNIRAAAIF